jgi:AraC-like DNA-binding protein
LRIELAHSVGPAAVDAQMLELRAPWGLKGEYRDGGGLYLAIEGGCHVRVGSRDLRLEPGDALFLPVGAPHALMDRPSTPTISVEQFCRTAIRSDGAMRFGGNGPVTRLATIGFLLDAQRPWIECLSPLHMRSARVGPLVRWLVASADLLRSPLPVTARIEVVRAVMAVLYALALEDPSLPPLSSRDDRIVRAYAAMRRQPDRRWTVGALAAVAGMSRSSFAAGFAACLGESPISHLRRLRLERAKAMSRLGMPQKTVAGSVGYAHGRSLARALRRFVT